MHMIFNAEQLIMDDKPNLTRKRRRSQDSAGMSVGECQAHYNAISTTPCRRNKGSKGTGIFRALTVGVLLVICFPTSDAFRVFSQPAIHRRFDGAPLFVATRPRILSEKYESQSIVLYPEDRLHENVPLQATSSSRIQQSAAVLDPPVDHRNKEKSFATEKDSEVSRIRPRNRPSSVKGATGKHNARMATEIMLAKAELEQNTSNTEGNVEYAYSTTPVDVSTTSLAIPSGVTSTKDGGQEKKRRGRPRKHAIPGGEKAIIKKITTVTKARAVTRRGRKSKSSKDPLVDSATSVTQNAKNAVSDHRTTKGPSTEMDAAAYSKYPTNRASAREYRNAFHRYYQTKLLGSEEEFSLGMKVRFMMQAEDVHQGLSAHLMRLPTLSEWSEACGFTSYDGVMSSRDFEDTNAVTMIRPQGSEGSFPTKEEIERESRMFIGDKGMGPQGPGRGKGRHRKKPAQLCLDVTKLKRQVRDIFPTILCNGTDADSYGSPRDFINVMNEARNAKQKMVESNMRLVVSIARRYHSVDGVGIPDLVQEGSMGLMRAVEKFDPTKGFKFSTYASWWIQQAIFRSMAYHSRTIRLPVHVHNLLSRIRRIRGSLQYELGRMPTTPEIAKELGMPPEKLAKMLRLTRKSISMDMPKYQQNPKDVGASSEESVGDMIDSTSRLADNYSPELSVDNGLFQEDLKDMLKILGHDERMVISLRYGLYDGLSRTVTAVADQLQVTKSWVRSQECRALRKLRRPWYEKRLKEHQDSLTS